SSSSPTPTPVSGEFGRSAMVDLAGTFRPRGVWALRDETLFVSRDAGATWSVERAEPGPKPVAASVLDASHSWIVVPGPGSTEFTGDVSDVLTLVVEATA